MLVCCNYDINMFDESLNLMFWTVTSHFGKLLSLNRQEVVLYNPEGSLTVLDTDDALYKVREGSVFSI